MKAIIQRFLLIIPFILALTSSGFATTLSASSTEVQIPQNLRVDVYSPRVAELFWDRAADPLTQYNVFRNGVLVREGQFGISFFDTTLQPSQRYTYTIIAINQSGHRSEAASIDIGVSGDEPAPSTVPAPQGLRASIYSSNVAELFWDRAADPFTRYDVFRNNELVKAGQFGISYFDRQFDGNGVTEYSVVAIDAENNRSDSTSIELGSPVPLVQPGNLSVSVYSDSAAELFWDRQDPGQVFIVLRDGIEVNRTDGTSYFDNTLPGKGSYTYEVFAIDSTGRRSSPATVVGFVGDTSQPTDGTNDVITLDNAVTVLQQLVPIATLRFFEPMVMQAEEASRIPVAVAFASLTEQPAPANGVTLIAGSDGGRPENSTVGFNGGRYTCDAGGTAAVPQFLGGESGTGFVVRFENCVLDSGIYTGQYQLSPSVPRSGNLRGDRLLGWQATANDGTRYRVQEYNKRATTQFNDRSQFTTELSATDFESVVDGQTTFIANLATLRISRFGTSLDFDQPDPNDAPVLRDFAEATLSSVFDVTADFTSQQRIDVQISLAFDYGGIENPVLRWQIGEITARADDGSEFRAIPIVSDTEASVRVSVRDGFVDVPYDDVF